MPPEFDPAWEYYCGNPDIEEMTTRKCGLNLNYEQVDSFRRGRISVVRKVRKDRVAPVSGNCRRCGHLFKPKSSKFKAVTVYCSRGCFYEHRAELTADRLRAIPGHRCQWCGGESGPRIKRGQLCVRPGKARKFCCRTCCNSYHAWRYRCAKAGRPVAPCNAYGTQTKRPALSGSSRPDHVG